MKTLIPQGSFTYLNCTATSQERTPRLLIRLPSSDNFRELTPNTKREAAFNNLGFYIDLQDSVSIILLINGTVNDTNSTSIKCSDEDTVRLTDLSDIYETTLVIYGR